MKQKKIGTDLYVFDTSAYQLTKDLDAENIYIQQELIPGYLAVNFSTGVQNKIKPINYKLNIIQKPVWGDYIYADDPKAELNVVFKSADEGHPTLDNPWLFDSTLDYETAYAQFFAEDPSIGPMVDGTVYSVTAGSDVIDLEEGSGAQAVKVKKLGDATVKYEWEEGETFAAGSATQNIKVVPVFGKFDYNLKTITAKYLPGETINITNDQMFKIAYLTDAISEDDIVMTFGDDTVLEAGQASGSELDLTVLKTGQTTLTISSLIFPQDYTWNINATRS